MSIYFNYCCMCRTHPEIRQGDSLPASLYTTFDLSYHRAVIYSQAYQSQAYTRPLFPNIKRLFLTHLPLNQTVIIFISHLSYYIHCCTLPNKRFLSHGKCLYQVMMTLHLTSLMTLNRHKQRYLRHNRLFKE